MHCCVTGLRLLHRPLAARLYVHPEFYTLSMHDAAHVITAMYNGAAPLDKQIFRLCFAVVLRHYGLLYADIYTPPYEPKRLDEISSVDFIEEVAAAFQIQAWASSQIRVQVAELTDCTARSVMEGVTHDSTSFVVATINSLPTSLSQQLYSWAETASKLSQTLADLCFQVDDIAHIVRVCLHLVALDAPLDEEPPDTYALMSSRVDRLMTERTTLFKAVGELGATYFSPSEKRMLKLLSQRAPRLPHNIQPVNSPLVDSGYLKSRLAELRGSLK